VRRVRWGAAVLGVHALAVGAVWYASRPDPPRAIVLPVLGPEAQEGKAAFDRHCVSCHGANAAGSATGPPLVHRTYHPALHADVTFELAVRRGVRAHDWRFGDMPPLPGVPPADVARITAYIRALQRANGISD